MFEQKIKIRGLRKLLMLSPEERRKKLGALGEKIVAEIYSKNGYVVIDRNLHTGHFGELDIVAVKNKTIHFVEVKTRISSRFGSAIESISVVKQAKLLNAIHYYIRQRAEFDAHVPYLHFAAVACDLDKSLFSVTIVDN